MFHGGAGWVGAETVSWTMRTGGEAAAAIGTHIFQNTLDTPFTESAFERANHCVR
jgi:hypothetical protein